MVEAIPQRVHLVGIGGIHMSAIAEILRARGHIVSGSDLRLSALTEKLQGQGIRIFAGHDEANVGEAELVVYTSAAPEDNPERAAAARLKIPTMKRAAMVAKLMEGKRVIAVAGTHGKTTTSSLIAHMLWHAGLSPTFMLGGEMVEPHTNVMAGSGPYFVVEADEYDSAFLHYQPEIALVTNIEPDHLDYYGSFQNIAAAFRRFLMQVSAFGHILACGENPALQALLSEAIGDGAPLPVRAVSYGLAGDFDWKAENIRKKGIDTCSFMVRCGQEIFGSFEIRLAGTHNVLNSLGAIAVGSIIGLSPDAIARALSEFRGVHRRFEVLGSAGDITVVDDYAHHPTEISATLAAARERFGPRRLVCVFQPHTYSRTAYLLEGFRECFREADVLLIAETYAAREEPGAGMSARDLAQQVAEPTARYSGGLEESAEAALEILRPGDVFFSIGAGDVDSVGRSVWKAVSE